ncbi:MAG TPA: hypothetical protein VEK15_25875 [Vicinamibacteria bacterium]|nr:hypothetical protein [Vicinamibacteria bacterium]
MQPLKAQSTFTAPEFVVKDSVGTVVGGFSAFAFRGQNEVAFHNPIHDENFHLQIRPDLILGETSEVYYTGNDCTGDAYVPSPVGSNSLNGLRGSTYGIGRKPGAINEDAYVIRGSGVGADNSAILNSRYRPFGMPPCDAVDPNSNTVLGEIVMDLSSYTRPFVVE